MWSYGENGLEYACHSKLFDRLTLLVPLYIPPMVISLISNEAFLGCLFGGPWLLSCFVLILRIVCPEQLIINGCGITYHKRNLSFSKGCSITRCFYPWDGISAVRLEWMGREDYRLQLKDCDGQVINIGLIGISYSKDDLLDAIRDCCPQCDIIDVSSFS